MAKDKLWHTDLESNAALVVSSGGLMTRKRGCGRGYAWMDLSEPRVYSCYISPNVAIEEFNRFLEDLSDDIRGSTLPVILGGDFNAKSYLWGDKQDGRGDAMAEWLSQNNISVANVGTTPTFVRREQKSVIEQDHR